jgi:hypothetical protein
MLYMQPELHEDTVFGQILLAPMPRSCGARYFVETRKSAESYHPSCGQYRKDTLIARFCGDVLMPDVRHLIAECPRKNAPGAACGVYYADLRERSY